MPRIYWLSKAFMRHPNVEIILSSMVGKLTGYCKCQGGKMKLKVNVARRGAGLLRWAERVWPPRNEVQPNREGVASGSAT